MPPIDSFWVKPIKEAIDDKLLDMITAENKHNILSEIKSYVQELLDYCPVASEKEFQEAVLDEYGVLYSADGRKLIKGNDDLKSYIIKPGTEIICDNAFKDCSLLGAINIPDSIRTIGHSAFCRCYALRSILLPESIKEIGTSVFWFCNQLNFVAFPSIKYLPSDIFVGCGLKEFEIPNTIRIIKSSSFASCNFKHIDIPPMVHTIENRAFFNCKNLESITFKRNELKKVGYDVFKQCDKLHSIYVPKIFKGHYIEVFKDIDPIKIVGYT